MRIALTGGIACGKSRVGALLNARGIATLDADDVVHTLIPEEERRRLAKTVFHDAAARKALEARIHPLVKERLLTWLAEGDLTEIRVAIIPLLFEVHWDAEFDILLCVTSKRATQVDRMMATRGYTREEAEARLAAQLPVEEKAKKSHYVIVNDGSVEELERSVNALVDWLKKEVSNGRRI